MGSYFSRKFNYKSIPLCLSLLLLSSIFGLQKPSLSKDLVQSFKGGKINWTTGIVIAWGEGDVPKGISDERLAKELAKRAAILKARENLIEIIKTVQLDSKVSIEDIVKSWGMVGEKIDRVSQISEIKSEFLSDERVRVTLELKIYEKLADAVYPFSPETGRVEPAKMAPFSIKEKAEQTREAVGMKRDGEPSLEEIKVAKEESSYTGIIIDARNLSVKPALFPKIFNEEEELIYNYTKVEYPYAEKEGVVGYVKDLKSAQRNPRVKPHPLVVRAVGVKGEEGTDIVIKDSDVKKIMKEEREGEFLKRGKVVIVLDR